MRGWHGARVSEPDPRSPGKTDFEVPFPHRVSGACLPVLVQQPAVPPHHERLRRGTLDLLSQGVVIPVEEADHEAGIVFLGECEEGRVERRLLLRRAVDDLAAGGKS